ncbi:hypothetical protein DFH09DRAFT_1372227 [Mycena vulgaris]|nr:hypothetical protein DFH09DRAFT_1372227 [Mycena vulgaris]
MSFDSASSCAEARTRISALDAQILELELAPVALRHERRALEDQLDSYTYPVLTLPNEIISEIFTHFIPVYPKSPPMVGIFSPLVLGQICHTWREIAVSTSSLWRAISLDFDQTEHHPTQLHLLEIWLDRSRASPLSVCIEYYNEDVAVLPMIDALVAQSFRWEEMELYLPLSHLSLWSSGNMPLLKTLTLGPIEEWPYWAEPIILFDQAPNLATVTLFPASNPFHPVLPWFQLTTLHGIRLLEHELVEILRLAGHIVRCSVTLMHCANDVDIPVIAPHLYLQDLTLSTATIPYVSEMQIFDKLTLPALRSLAIPEPWFSPNPGVSIAAWISRSGCDLKQLHITHSEESELYYRKALPSVGNISTDYALASGVDDGDSDW